MRFDCLSYNPLRAAPANRAIAAADALTWAAPLNAKATNYNPFVAVSAEGTNASATMDIEVGLYHYDGTTYTFLGVVKKSTITLSAGTEKNGATNFVGLSIPTFDTMGATHYDARCVAISAGTGTIKPWTFGAKPA